MAQRSFTIRLRKDKESGYYAARCVELPEVISQGKTEREALDNAKEALELVLEEYDSQTKKEGDKLIPRSSLKSFGQQWLQLQIDLRTLDLEH